MEALLALPAVAIWVAVLAFIALAILAHTAERADQASAEAGDRWPDAAGA